MGGCDSAVDGGQFAIESIHLFRDIKSLPYLFVYRWCNSVNRSHNIHVRGEGGGVVAVK